MVLAASLVILSMGGYWVFGAMAGSSLFLPTPPDYRSATASETADLQAKLEKGTKLDTAYYNDAEGSLVVVTEEKNDGSWALPAMPDGVEMSKYLANEANRRWLSRSSVESVLVGIAPADAWSATDITEEYLVCGRPAIRLAWYEPLPDGRVMEERSYILVLDGNRCQVSVIKPSGSAFPEVEWLWWNILIN